MAKGLKASVVAKLLRKPLVEPEVSTRPKPAYVPRAPEHSLQDAIASAKLRRARPSPTKSDPTEAYFESEKLKSNVFCRLLAAHPKMDFHTRMMLPSTLMVKLGFENNQFGPVSSSNSVLKGPRAYSNFVSSNALIGPNKFLVEKAPEYKAYTINKDFYDASRRVHIGEIQRLIKLYEPAGPVIAYLNAVPGGEDYPGALHIDLSQLPQDNLPVLPQTITSGKHRIGVRIVGQLYVYLQAEIGRNLLDQHANSKKKKK